MLNIFAHAEHAAHNPWYSQWFIAFLISFFIGGLLVWTATSLIIGITPDEKRQK